jgi:hypothetical protein
MLLMWVFNSFECAEGYQEIGERLTVDQKAPDILDASQ